MENSRTLDYGVMALLAIAALCLVVMIICSWTPGSIAGLVSDIAFVILGWLIGLFLVLNPDRARQFSMNLRKAYPKSFTNRFSDLDGYWRAMKWLAYFVLVVTAINTLKVIFRLYAFLR